MKKRLAILGTLWLKEAELAGRTRATRIVAALILGFALLLTTTPASALLISLSSGSRAASADFSVSGTALTIVLTNTSTSDVMDPTEVLIALFFDVEGIGALTPSSALLSGGSTVFFGPDGGGNVGGEWAYASGLAGAPNGATEGISSAGFGLFGAANFGGANLNGPISVNGLNYGITSAGDNTATGNAAVTGNAPLIKNQVTFTLTNSGLSGFVPSADNITTVSFQYGTSLTDVNLVPEPASLFLLGSGLVGIGFWGRKRFLKSSKS